MYVPAHNQVTDRTAMLAFMRTHAFAALISHGDAGLRATHLPVLVDGGEDGAGDAGRVHVLFHLAKANPQWRDFLPGREVMLIFNGPHAYISPRYYERAESVPTWNYAAVHGYGIPHIMESAEEKYQLLERLIALQDPGYLAQFQQLRQEYVSNRLAAIVAFTIQLKRLEARFKLSQDRLPTERERIMVALEACGEGAATETAQLMRACEA